MQIYIKARGLSDAVFNRPTGYTQSTEELTALRKLLSLMKLPEIQNTPLHLEVIVQFEEKSVLSFFMNQNTFQNLTDGDSKCGLQADHETNKLTLLLLLQLSIG